MKVPITAVIIAQNEASMIGACIATLEWCESVLVIDDGSSDETVQLAEQAGARVIHYKQRSFAKLRSEALKHIATEWLFYIDADERVTPTLAKEIQVQLEMNPDVALTLKRQNYFFGQLLENGGWESDTVTRVFRKSQLTGWTGTIHESPIFSGTATELQTV